MLTALALKPGMVVADVGAGTGYLSRRMAAAVDVQPEMIQILKQLAQQAQLSQIVPVQCSKTDVDLPSASVDLAIMVDVHHAADVP